MASQKNIKGRLFILLLIALGANSSYLWKTKEDVVASYVGHYELSESGTVNMSSHNEESNQLDMTDSEDGSDGKAQKDSKKSDTEDPVNDGHLTLRDHDVKYEIFKVGVDEDDKSKVKYKVLLHGISLEELKDKPDGYGICKGCTETYEVTHSPIKSDDEQSFKDIQEAVVQNFEKKVRKFKKAKDAAEEEERLAEEEKTKAEEKAKKLKEKEDAEEERLAKADDARKKDRNGDNEDEALDEKNYITDKCGTAYFKSNISSKNSIGYKCALRAFKVGINAGKIKSDDVASLYNLYIRDQMEDKLTSSDNYDDLIAAQDQAKSLLKIRAFKKSTKVASDLKSKISRSKEVAVDMAADTYNDLDKDDPESKKEARTFALQVMRDLDGADSLVYKNQLAAMLRNNDIADLRSLIQEKYYPALALSKTDPYSGQMLLNEFWNDGRNYLSNFQGQLNSLTSAYTSGLDANSRGFAMPQIYQAYTAPLKPYITAFSNGNINSLNIPAMPVNSGLSATGALALTPGVLGTDSYGITSAAPISLGGGSQLRDQGVVMPQANRAPLMPQAGPPIIGSPVQQPNYISSGPGFWGGTQLNQPRGVYSPVYPNNGLVGGGPRFQ